MSRSPSRTLATWGGSLIIAAVAFGVYLRFVGTGPLPVDRWWIGIAQTTRGSAMHAVAVFFAEAGSMLGALAVTAIAVALLLVLRRRRDAGAVATAVIFGAAGSELIKALVLRPRPGDQLAASFGSSYPSGHSTAAAALAVSLALVVAYADDFPARTAGFAWAIALTWTLVMMWSRTALRVHWLSDTVAGALLGVGAALLARSLWMPTAHKQAAGSLMRK
ncbi:MAG: phosphatase PAP2 family protein [Leucobacter sp.]